VEEARVPGRALIELRLSLVHAFDCHSAQLLQPGLLRFLHGVVEGQIVGRFDVNVSPCLLDAYEGDAGSDIDFGRAWCELDKGTEVLARAIVGSIAQTVSGRDTRACERFREARNEVSAERRRPVRTQCIVLSLRVRAKDLSTFGIDLDMAGPILSCRLDEDVWRLFLVCLGGEVETQVPYMC